MPIDLDSFKTQYGQQIGKSQRSKGFAGMLDDLNGILDQEIASKRERQNTAEARAYDTQQTAAQNTEWDRRQGITSGQQTDAALLQTNMATEQARIAEEKARKEQEELAAWMTQASEATTALYAAPDDPDAFRSSMAAITEANQQIIKLRGSPVDINGVMTQTRMLREELRVINDNRNLSRAEKSVDDVKLALDEWGSASAEDKDAAANALARAITIAKIEGNTSPILDSILDALPLGGVPPNDANGLKPMTSAETRSEINFLENMAPAGSKLGRVIPKLATSNADSAALANRMIGEIPGRGADSTVQRRANEVRASFIEGKGRKSGRSVLPAFNRVVTGATADTIEVAEKPGPAKKSYPEDKIIDAWVAVSQKVRDTPEDHARALKRVPDSIRARVKEALGW